MPPSLTYCLLIVLSLFNYLSLHPPPPSSLSLLLFVPLLSYLSFPLLNCLPIFSLSICLIACRPSCLLVSPSLFCCYFYRSSIIARSSSFLFVLFVCGQSLPVYFCVYVCPCLFVYVSLYVWSSLSLPPPPICFCLCLPACLSVCVSVCQSVCLVIPPPPTPPICFCFCLPACQSVCLSVSVSVSVSLSLSVCLSLFL